MAEAGVVRTKEEVQAYLDAHPEIQSTVQAALEKVVQSMPDEPMPALADILKGGGAAAAPTGAATSAAGLLPRPRTAVGTFLRMLTVNDVYKLDNYPRVATAVNTAKGEAAALDCVVTSHLNGDYLSPCTLTAIDGGRGMTEGLDHAKIDYVCLGNHEFDFGFDVCATRAKQFKGKVINSNVSTAQVADLPKYDVVAVGDKKVLIGGFLTKDTSIYAPTNTPTVTPPEEAAPALWDLAKKELGYTPDVFVPMTHQLVPEDKAFGTSLAKHAELSKRTPFILAGHEHGARPPLSIPLPSDCSLLTPASYSRIRRRLDTPASAEMYIDEAGKSTIVKTGQDAERIGVCDVWWDASGKMHSCSTVLPASEFAAEPVAQQFVDEQAAFVKSMMDAQIAIVTQPMTSKKVRFEPSGVATFLLTFVQRALKKDGVELATVQGGFVRAKKDYEPGPFKMGDLFSEFAFEGPMAIIPVKGSILNDSMRTTRGAPKPSPNFLHFDAGVVVEGEVDDCNIVSVGGVPFDPEKIYTIAIYQFLLTGLNVIEPLMSYVREHVTVPDVEACRPVKDVVVEICMKDEWRRIIGFEQLDADGDGQVSKEELHAGIAKMIAAIDHNGDGSVSKEELSEHVAKIGGDTALVEQLVKTLDHNGDGMISKEEFEDLVY